MTRMTAKDFPPELLELYDFYAHGKITKREFLDRAGKFTLGGLTAMARAGPDEPRLRAGPAGQLYRPGYRGRIRDVPLAQRSWSRCAAIWCARRRQPASCRPWWSCMKTAGLNPYIEDVARRVAKAGFMALAPDGLTSVGGYPGNDDKGRELQATVDSTKLMNDFFAAIEWLMAHEAIDRARSGSPGSAMVAVSPMRRRWPTRNWAGRCRSMAVRPAAADVPKIKCPLLIHYAELDERVNAGWPEYEAALKAAGTRYEAHIYPGANHGFHNDSTPRYDEAAAKLAWDRTLAFFTANLA